VSLFKFLRGTRENSFGIGDGTDGNKVLEANNGDANVPVIRYNSSTNKWEFANDGVTFAAIGSGTSTFAPSVIAKTGNGTLSAAECANGNLITNTGAGSDIALALPAGAIGYELDLEVTAAYYLKLTANGTETFKFYSLVSAAGGYVRSNIVGTRWKLTWNGALWAVHDINGFVSYDE
jgi:hypothetical protein